MTDLKVDTLARLARTVAGRRSAAPETSYTAKLLAEGVERCAKKFGEEAIETALAAVGGDRRHITAEAADLLYHLIVLLEASDVLLEDVMAELERRFGQGGLAEKAARNKE